MTRRVLAVLAAMVFVFVVSAAVTYAQEGAVADIGFKFVAAGKTMPPGKYDLTINSDRSAFTLAPDGKGAGVILVAMTRLAAPESPSSDTRFVFDKVGDNYFLSEMWLPGEDGYLFYAAKEKHTHQVVTGQRKTK
jgi:hypothetical protein